MSRLRAPLPAVLALALAACSGTAGAEGLDLQTPSSAASTAAAVPSAPAAAPTSATPAFSATQREEDKVLAQYRRFFATITPASLASQRERAAMLKELAVNPSYERVLGGMFTSDQLGEVGYGETRTSPKITRLRGSTAWIRDCQDSSQHGRMKRDTGKKVTVGKKNELAVATMRRGDDGVWRMATTEYPGDTC